MNEMNVIAVRGMLSKQGYPDIKLELRRRSFDFGIFENDKEVAAFWQTISPLQAIRGTAVTLSIQEAWQKVLAKHYPDYSVTNMEEGFA